MTVPEGKTQSRWFRIGYQQALRDLHEALKNHGEHGAREWIANNMIIKTEIDRRES